MAEGKSNKLIAAELDISEGTVKTHMKSILPKLDAPRTYAVMIALKRQAPLIDTAALCCRARITLAHDGPTRHPAP